MTEVKLRVGVDSRPAEAGAARVERALGNLGRKAKKTETQLQRLTRQLGGMQSVFAGLGVGIVVTQFTKLLDAATTVDNKLRVVTNTTAELNAVYDELIRVSNLTRTSLENNAGLFQRVGLATKSLGLTFKEQTDLIEGFNKALVISGTNAQEARAVTTQFAQAIGSGFKGDELRSIIEQAPRVAEVISDSLGLSSVQELKKFASTGQLVPQLVVDAFKEAQGQLAFEFSKVNITIGQGFQVMSNSVLSLIRDFNNMSKTSIMLGGMLKVLADNIDVVAGAALGLAVIIGTQLVSAFARMTVVFLTNPIGVLITAFVAAGAAAAHFGGEIFKVGERSASGFQIARAAFQTFFEVLQPVINLAVAGFEMMARGIQSFVSSSSEDLPSFSDVVVTVFNFVLSTVKFTADAIVIAFGDMPSALKLLFTEAANGIITVFEKILNSTTELVAKSASIIALYDVDLAQKIQAGIRKSLGIQLTRIALSNEEIDTAGKLKVAYDSAFSTVQVEKFGKSFSTNLTKIQTQEKLGLPDPTQLSNVFSTGSGADTRLTDPGESGGLKKLQQERKSFVKGLEGDFESLRSETGQAKQVVNEWYDSQKQQVASLGLSWEEYGGKIEAVFQDKLKEAYLKDLEAADDWASGVERAAFKLGESMGTSADAAASAFTSVFGGMEDALTEFVSTGQLDFKKFADSILKDLTRIAVQQAIIKPLSQSFTGGGGGGGGGMLGGLFGGLFKEGGLSTQPTSVGLMPSNLSNVPRFASGGMTSGGGFPAILHPNEAVIPLSGGRKVPVEMNGQGQGGTNNIVFNISTPDADSFRRSQGQILAKTQATMARASKRNN